MPDEDKNNVEQPPIAAPAAIPDEEPKIPDVLRVFPIREVVLFPSMILPIGVPPGRDAVLVDQALLQDRLAAFVPVINPNADPPGPEALHGFGCAGQILKMVKLPYGGMRILVQGLKRVRIET